MRLEDPLPTVFCVVAVHNRLEFTARFLTQMNSQDYPRVQIVIVDDGSRDGTSAYLAKNGQPNLTVLMGTGKLWWAGAMRMGMKWVDTVAKERDFLLMLNDDVSFANDYVSTLVQESAESGRAIVGSSQRDEVTGKLIGAGYLVDFVGMRIIHNREPCRRVDSLPGRGVLFPYAAIREAGPIRARIFPHYFADLEYSCRAAELGWKLIISDRAPVFVSQESSDSKVRAKGRWSSLISLRSKDCLVHRLLFFSLRGPWLLRVLAIPRYCLLGGIRYLAALRA